MLKLNKILFFAEAQLGDLLLLTPAIKGLKTAYPSSKITLLLLHRRYYSNVITHNEITKTKFETTSQVFYNNPDIEEIYELDRQTIRSLKGIQRLMAEFKCISFLRKQKFDAMICTFPQNRFLAWSYLSGCRIIVGQKEQPMSRMITHSVNTTPKKEGVLNYYCSLLKPLGVNKVYDKPVYNVTVEEKKHSIELLKRLGIDPEKKVLFVHPGASSNYKVWPPQFFAQIIDYVVENKIAQVVIGSNKFDKETVEAFIKAAKNTVTSIEFNSIREMAAVISLCSLSLVNNSGPRHISAAVGTRSISIFQKFDDGEWKIYDSELHPVIEHEDSCPHCKNKCESVIPEGEKFGSLCVRLIKPHQVIAKISDIFQKIS